MSEAPVPEQQRLADIVASIIETDADVTDIARKHQLNLTKPPGSLGRIEDVGVQLAAMSTLR